MLQVESRESPQKNWLGREMIIIKNGHLKTILCRYVHDYRNTDEAMS